MADNDLLEHIEWSRPWLYEKQERAIFCDERYSVIEASTKSGKTIGCAIWLLEQAMFKEGNGTKIFRWIAPVNRQVEVAWKRFQTLLEYFPGDGSSKKDFSSDHVYKVWKDSPKTIKFINGSIIEFHTGDDPDPLYGEDVWATVIDEFTRCKEGVWEAVRSTHTYTQGPVRFIGNVKGRNNWGYKLARRAEQGLPNWQYEMITAWDAVRAGVLKAEEIVDAKNSMEDWKFSMLYECKPPPDGGNPFGIDHIRTIAKEWDTEDGLAEGDPVCWGWDVAESNNFTVGIGLNRDGEVCRFLRFQDSWGQTADRIVAATGKNVIAYVDTTGVGKGLKAMLEDRGAQNFKEFTFSGKSKQELMSDLAISVQNHEIAIPANSRIETEMETFEYEERRTYTRYTAPDGVHDDCVDSLALAVKRYNEMGRMPDDAAPVGGQQQSYWRGTRSRFNRGRSASMENLEIAM